ncbi:MAG TPA: sigma 54-interacting transcriptional regulator [Candidatus Acidoferrales bacterium]|nr:sigma 54-interacting transcriptional regulator [Candidatus Acidoferrales bacterium]
MEAISPLRAAITPTDPEAASLRACINDLVGIVALPAIWTGGEPSHIVRILLDAIVHTLRLDIAYVQLADRTGGTLVETAWAAESRNLPLATKQIREALHRRLGNDIRTWPPLVRHAMFGHDISIAPVRLGVHGEIGVMLAGSVREDFPRQTERLLLSVAANQAAIALQEVRLLSEQKRAATELDQRVAQRTKELAVVNEELIKENAERRRAEEKLRALQQQLESHNAYLQEEVDSALSFGRIVGRGRELRHVLQHVEDVASTDATVLITGESGTGKELLAREIHERSRRSQRPFVRVNCSAIPREMFESEFFGHVRGAFTGAVRDRPGRFQVANGGTIFLDEIGDLPFEMQPKLLRVLQEREYERVGEDITHNVDVRVIAATNKDLAEEVRAHRFRQDLFYRLNVFPLGLPPLRARRDDIPLLAAHAITEVAKRLRIHAPMLTQADVARLKQYDWPGNIRELNNVIERAVILSKGAQLRLDIAFADLSGAPVSASLAAEVILTDRECRERERANLIKALERADGRVYGKGGAAEWLAMNPTTLASRLRAFKITPTKPQALQNDSAKVKHSSRASDSDAGHNR